MAVSTEAQRKEDSWAWVDMGNPFPDGPMRVKGEMNQYVALWYKHGKPVTGRAWNDGGKVQCSFKCPVANKELNTVRDLSGKIQILTFDNLKDNIENWKESGFYYEWLTWAESKTKKNTSIVRCGDSAPILVTGNDGKTYCGNMEISKEIATVAHDGKCVTKKAADVAGLLTLVRNYVDPTPPPEAPPPQPVDMDDRWIDLKEGDDWAKVKNTCISALEGQALKGQTGTAANPAVVLWYMCGQPVMGAMWNAGGKIQCAFGWNGREYKSNIGSIQVLVYNPRVAAFKIAWKTYAEAIKPGSGWRPVKVTHSGVDCCPCVIEHNGKEFLGKCIVSQEKASYPDGGKEVEFSGPVVKTFKVLARTN